MDFTVCLHVYPVVLFVFEHMSFLIENSEIMTSLSPRYLKKILTDYFYFATTTYQFPADKQNLARLQGPVFSYNAAKGV